MLGDPCRIPSLACEDRAGAAAGAARTARRHPPLADAGIQTVLSGVRLSRLNAIMECWIRGYRRELLDPTLIWNQQHLLHALHEYERFYNTHRPHQGIDNARPLQPLPQPAPDQAPLTHLDIRRRQRLGGILNEYHHAA